LLLVETAGQDPKVSFGTRVRAGELTERSSIRRGLMKGKDITHIGSIWISRPIITHQKKHVDKVQGQEGTKDAVQGGLTGGSTNVFDGTWVNSFQVSTAKTSSCKY